MVGDECPQLSGVDLWSRPGQQQQMAVVAEDEFSPQTFDGKGDRVDAIEAVGGDDVDQCVVGPPGELGSDADAGFVADQCDATNRCPDCCVDNPAEHGPARDGRQRIGGCSSLLGGAGRSWSEHQGSNLGAIHLSIVIASGQAT